MISVVIPCFNCELFVERAIASVYEQTYHDWELILVDNNSSDGTLTLLQKYQQQDPKRVKIISEPVKGAPAARNAGLRLAEGTWIQFLDADDILLPTKFLRQVELVRKNPCSIVASNALVQIRKNPSRSDYTKKVYSADEWIALILSEAGITSTNLWKRDELIKAGLWNTKLPSSQEYHLIFEILKKGGNILFDQEVSAVVYKDSSGISKAKNLDSIKRIVEGKVELRKQIVTFLQDEKSLSNERVRAFNNYVFLELMAVRGFLPAYVREKLKQYRIRVSFSVLTKGYWLFFKSVIKRIIKWN